MDGPRGNDRVDHETSTPRIDRPILEDVRDRLRTAQQFTTVEIVVTDGQTRLEATVDPAFDPPNVDRRFLDVRWYTNDDFRIHYREEWANRKWMQRWDRHPSTHNDRDHFHPPPDAATPGDDRTWPDDHRDVLALVCSTLADRQDTIWNDDR